MKLLFVHQNFPGQFPHIAPEMARRGHDVLALTDQGNARPSPVTIPTHASSSARKRSNASLSPSRIAPSIALSFSGRS